MPDLQSEAVEVLQRLVRSEEHTSELQSLRHLVCRLLLEKKKKQMLRDFIGIRVNRAKKSGMVNITSSVICRERSGINTILHDLNSFFFFFNDTATTEIYTLSLHDALPI